MSGQVNTEIESCDNFVNYIQNIEEEEKIDKKDRLTREQITNFGRERNSADVERQISTYIQTHSTETTYPAGNYMGACPEYNSPNDKLLNLGGKKRRSFRRKMSKKKKGGKTKRKRTQKKKKGGKKKSTRKQKRT
jgi:hypothetical protein